MPKKVIYALIGSALGIQVSFAEEKYDDFIESINLGIEYLSQESDQHESDNAALGLSYDIDHDFLEDSDARFAFIGRGLIATDKAANPKNFLENEIDIGLEKDWKTDTPYNVKCSEEGGMSKLECEALSRVGEKHQNITTLNFNLGASYESNQNFSEKQLVYGSNLMFKYYGYSKVNYIFDAPFLVTRWLSGAELSKEPGIRKTYQGAIPTIRIAFEQVNPEHNDARFSVLGNRDKFYRWNTDIGFTTVMAQIKGKEINFNYFWRYYKEIDADDAIRDAGLDEFSNSSAVFIYGGKIYFSYSSGKLPLTKRNSEGFEVGLRCKFENLWDCLQWDCLQYTESPNE